MPVAVTMETEYEILFLLNMNSFIFCVFVVFVLFIILLHDCLY